MIAYEIYQCLYLKSIAENLTVPLNSLICTLIIDKILNLPLEREKLPRCVKKGLGMNSLI